MTNQELIAKALSWAAIYGNVMEPTHWDMQREKKAAELAKQIEEVTAQSAAWMDSTMQAGW